MFSPFKLRTTSCHDSTSLNCCITADSALDDGYGSFTTEAGEATCPCTSALPRKQTKCRSSQQVRFVPKADSCIAANCAIGCLATLGTSSLTLGGQQPLGRLQKRCPVPARSNVQGAMFKPRGHTMSEFTFLF